MHRTTSAGRVRRTSVGHPAAGRPPDVRRTSTVGRPPDASAGRSSDVRPTGACRCAGSEDCQCPGHGLYIARSRWQFLRSAHATITPRSGGDRESFRGNSSKKIDFAHRSDVAARELREVESYALSKFQLPTTFGDPQNFEKTIRMKIDLFFSEISFSLFLVDFGGARQL